MASIAVGSSQTFTAGVRDAVFVVVINGGTYATVTGAQSASLGPSPVRRSFGPFAVGESITVAVQSGDAAIVEYGDQTPGEVGGANSWLSGAQTSAGATGVAGVTASGALVAPDGGAVSIGSLTPYVGQVATRCYVPNNKHNANKQGMCRSAHFARSRMTQVKLGYANWAVLTSASTPTSGSGAETLSGGSTTYSVAVEYPAGTFTRITFNGSATGTAADGENIFSDMVTLTTPIPAGAQFWVRTWVSHSGFIVYSGVFAGSIGTGAAMGEGAVFGVSGIADVTMGGAVTAATTVNIYPIAILSNTTKPAFMQITDSRGAGVNDTLDRSGDTGYISRAVGGYCGYFGSMVPSDRMTYAAANFTRRVALAAYASHVVIQLGINDIRSGGRTAAQVATDRTTIINALLAVNPSLRIYVCTLDPSSTSTDSFATLLNQTTDASNSVRVTYNNNARTTYDANIVSILDVADASESGRDSGIWAVTGTANATTSDGLHASAYGYRQIAAQLRILQTMGLQ